MFGTNAFLEMVVRRIAFQSSGKKSQFQTTT